MKKQLVVPKFKNEAEEAFWAKLDLSEYFEPSDFLTFGQTTLAEQGKQFCEKQRSGTERERGGSC